MHKFVRLPVLVLWVALATACDGNKPTETVGLADGPNRPKFVRLSWNADPATTVAVVWYTETQVAGAGVEFGPTPKYGRFVPAYSFELPKWPGQFHQATLHELAPGTLVHYRVGSASGVSADYVVATAAQTGPFSFVLMGDSRSSTLGIGAGYPQLLQRIRKENPLPAFILDSGDYTMLSQVEEWMDWLDAGQGVNELIPRLTTFGNHEMVEKTYYGLMNLPGNERWYSLDYGPLHIVCLNTSFGTIDQAQKAWLEADLKASQAKWKLVFFHMPPYNAGNHNDINTREQVREQWGPLFEQYGVDLVLGGHDHNYQRFGFIRAGQRAAPGTAPFYLVSGGAGAPLYSYQARAEDAPLVEKFEAIEHYVLATLDGNTLRLEAKRLDGTVFDTITLSK